MKRARIGTEKVANNKQESFPEGYIPKVFSYIPGASFFAFQVFCFVLKQGLGWPRTQEICPTLPLEHKVCAASFFLVVENLFFFSINSAWFASGYWAACKKTI